MRTLILIILLLICLLTSPAAALIHGGIGNDPVNDPGWPKGALEIANLKSRVGWWEGPPFGGGQYQYLYRGDTAAFTAALELFAKMKTPVRELVIHDGPQESWYLNIDRKSDKKIDSRTDWTFTVWIPSHWHRLYNTPGATYLSGDPNFGKPLEPPRIDVYVDATGKGSIDWSKVKVPANIRVIDKRAAAAGVKVEGGAVVHVNAYDMATGKPVVGAKLRITERNEDGKDISTGIANEDGLAAATKIPAGVYRISLEADGYAPRIIGYEELSAVTFRTYDIELSKAARVAGTVVDESGKPLAGVNVRASALGIDGRGYNLPDINQVTTNAEGRFEFTALPAGHVRLQTYSKGHHQLDIFKLHPAPSSNITIQVAMTGSIKGKVLGKDGKPAAGRRHIFIVPEGGAQKGKWSASGTLAADGSFEFHQVPPGKYYAAPTQIEGDPEAKKDTKSFLVKPGETREVMIEVE